MSEMPDVGDRILFIHEGEGTVVSVWSASGHFLVAPDDPEAKYTADHPPYGPVWMFYVTDMPDHIRIVSRAADRYDNWNTFPDTDTATDSKQ